MSDDEYLEEQADEIEALESIFMEDFEKLGDSPPSFRITLVPIPGTAVDDEENHVACELTVEYPATYPEVAPIIELKDLKGLSKNKIETLTEIANESAEEELGDVCVFSITEAIKEWMVDHNEPELTAHELMMERINADEDKEKKKAEEEAERRRLEAEEAAKYVSPYGADHDTLVNKDTFKLWNDMFLADANKGKKVLPGEHTGKQIFLNNMLLGVEKEEEGDKKEGGEGEKEVFYFNQSLYGEADDDLEDLPDTDDDDDSDV